MKIDVIPKNMVFKRGNKEYTMSISNHDVVVIKRISKVMEMAINNGINCNGYIYFKGKPYIRYKENIYVIRENNKLIEYQLGLLHGTIKRAFHSRVKGIKLEESKIYKDVQENLRQIKYFRGILLFKHNASVIDELLIKLIDLNQTNIIHVNKTMSSKKIINKIQKDIKLRCIIDSTLYKSKINEDKDGNPTFILEQPQNGCAVEDLADVILIMWENLKYSVEDVEDLIEAYRTIKNMSHIDFKILFALLRQPRVLYNMLRRYLIAEDHLTKKMIIDYMDYSYKKEKLILYLESMYLI